VCFTPDKDTKLFRLPQTKHNLACTCTFSNTTDKNKQNRHHRDKELEHVISKVGRFRENKT
jgi:hypothetical protein